MRQNHDASHEINVIHFEDLILICEAMGTRYNPPATSLKTQALRNMLTAGKTCFTALTNANELLSQSIGIRKAKIEMLRPLATRITNNFAVCDVTPEAIEHIRSINKKIQKGIQITHPEGNPENPEGGSQQESGRKSTQQSIDHLVSFWDELVTALNLEPKYLATDTELTVDALQMMMDDIHELNTTIKTKDIACNATRLDRDECLYEEQLGIVDTAYKVKLYLKSTLGANSTEYKAVDKLRFFRYEFEEHAVSTPTPPIS